MIAKEVSRHMEIREKKLKAGLDDSLAPMLKLML